MNFAAPMAVCVCAVKGTHTSKTNDNSRNGYPLTLAVPFRGIERSYGILLLEDQFPESLYSLSLTLVRGSVEATWWEFYM